MQQIIVHQGHSGNSPSFFFISNKLINYYICYIYSSNRYPNATTPTPVPSPPPQNFNSSRIIDREAAERERVRMEFYATYDVMTGVRIAATLGGFFGLMVFLVVYKSRGESQETIKALKVNELFFFFFKE